MLRQLPNRDLDRLEKIADEAEWDEIKIDVQDARKERAR